MTVISRDGDSGDADGSSSASGNSLARFVIASITLFLVWCALAGSLSINEVILGGVVASGVALISASQLNIIDDLRLSPLLPLYFLQFLGVFLVALVGANLDVARRVLSPRVAVNPQIVTIHTELQSNLGRFWLANAITLTPGTLTTDVDDEMLRIHWIDIGPGADLESATRAIAARFEASLKRIVK